MSTVCHETSETLLNDGLQIYKATYRVSAVKRGDEGKLLISNQEHTIGKNTYIRLIGSLVENPGDISDEVFFTVNDREGYDGAGISPDVFKPKGYQFIPYQRGEQYLPNCFRDLTSRLDDMEWLDTKLVLEVPLEE